MKRSALFLQASVILTGIGALAFLLFEPLVEGRNANAKFFDIYFTDPFLALVYIASVPFFAALYKAFIVLRLVREDKTFSQETLKALRTIKYCALTVIGFVAVSIIFIYPIYGGKDDRPAGVFMRIFISFALSVIAAAAGLIEGILHNAMKKKLSIDSVGKSEKEPNIRSL